LVVAVRPLRLDQIIEHEAGTDDLAHPVTNGPVMFDVRRLALIVLLDISASVEI